MNTPMDTVTVQPLPKLRALPATLPLEGAVRIELEQGIPVFRACSSVQARIEELLVKERGVGLTAEEKEELDCYEEIDDFLSFINRVIRNLLQSQPGKGTWRVSPRRRISSEIQRLVRQRANDLYEYCHTSERWEYVRFTTGHRTRKRVESGQHCLYTPRQRQVRDSQTVWL